MNCVKQGMLLLQLGVVFAIFILLLSYSLPRITAFNALLLHNDVQKLRTFFLYVQRVAMATGKIQYIQFFPHEGIVIGAGKKERLLPQNIFGGLPGMLGPPSQPRNSITSYSTFDSDKVACYPSGIIQPGTIYLKNKTGTLMCALSCSVSSASYLRTYKYDSGWKLIS